MSLAFLAGATVQGQFSILERAKRVLVRTLVPASTGSDVPSQASRIDDWDVPERELGNLEIFVLAGQSNMSGRGDPRSPDTPLSRHRIYAFNKDYRWHIAAEPLGTVARSREVDPVAIDGATGVGPGLSFAHALVDLDPSISIGLVPCARGASTIEEWQPNKSQNSLYGACLKRALASRSYGSIRAVLFSQGESDADDPALNSENVLSPHDWTDKFELMVTGLRADLEQPDLPIIYAQLGSASQSMALPNWERVREQQAHVRLANVRMVMTEGLLLEADGHFQTAAQVEIGRKFAATYVDVVREAQ